MEFHEKRRILAQVNGVLFPGGSLDDYPDVYPEYFTAAREIIRYGVERNRLVPTEDGFKPADPFLIWGTCEGFQVLSAAASGAKGLDAINNKAYNGAWFKMYPLEFPVGGNSGILFNSSNTPMDVLTALKSFNTTLNVHHDGLTPDQYISNSSEGINESDADAINAALARKMENNFRDMAISDLWEVVTINHDRLSGKPFVSTIEAKYGINMFGVQWHPEWPTYEWDVSDVTHNEHTLRVSSYIANFIRQRLSLSLPQHKWTSPEVLEASVIEQSPIAYRGWGKFEYWPHATWDLNTPPPSPPVSEQPPSVPNDNDAAGDGAEGSATEEQDIDDTDVAADSNYIVAGAIVVVCILAVIVAYQHYTSFNDDLKKKMEAQSKANHYAPAEASQPAFITQGGRVVRKDSIA